MLNEGFKKTFLLGSTMIAGFAAVAVSVAPAYAQTSPVPGAQVQTPPQAADTEAPNDQARPPATAEEADRAERAAAGQQGEVQDDVESGRQSVQQASSGDEVETVVVTGSRIARPQYEGNIPGAQVDEVEIERRAFTNALDILNNVPLVGNGTSLNTNGGQPSSLGVGFVDLLDLGTNRTLTLVNGRRFVSGNAATLFVAGNATGSQVDVNNIPVSLIERVDVLTVGGAAAYGSDAIAGVVNYILKDDYEGSEIGLIAGANDDGEAGRFSLQALVGRNFLDERANLALSYEYNYLDSFLIEDVDFRRTNPRALTNFANGGARNSLFNPRALTAGGNTAFIPAANDFNPGTTFFNRLTTVQQSPGGVVFNVVGAGPAGAVNQVGPAGSGFFAINTQLIAGTPVPCVAVSAAAGFCAFAPSALPATVTTAQVFARFGVTPPAGSTAAEQRTLALQIVQANRPTPREFFAQNPNVPLNAFLGTLIPSFPDIANTDPATSGVLPRIAVPLRFNAQGNLETFRVATLTPATPGQADRAPDGEGADLTVPFGVDRIQQDRHVANLFGKFQINDNFELFTENLYANIQAFSPRGFLGTNGAGNGTIEAAPLIVNVNNPFLDAADRATLASAGITGNFVLGRSNDDLGQGTSEGEVTTYRTVNGVRGDFDLLGRTFDWETSFNYGRTYSQITLQAFGDLEYVMALDAARDPATGNVVCRSQLNPAAFIGTTPSGISANLTRLPGADGVRTEQILTPTITRELIDACRPFNPFGANQSSAEAQAFIRAENIYYNESEQLFGQAFLSGTVIGLPAGDLGFGVAAEIRRETLEFTTNERNRLGRTRSAPSAQTSGEIQAVEYGVEFRIPVFGGDFRFPGLHTLDISPAVRYSRQEGEPSFRNLGGQLVEQSSEGDTARIESLALTYKPIEDVTLRANVSKSIRQPSITELFLGGQPAFINAFTDPCSNANINGGPNPAKRRANCIAAVVAQGLAPNTAAAETFLNSFVPTGASVQGTFAGSPGLSPEEADSHTVGIVLEPRFIPRFRFSVDYIAVDLAKEINPTNLTQALQFCFDSNDFPDTTPRFGANTCAFFSRDPTFNVTSGFTSGYLNLAATRLKAYNISADYSFEVEDLTRHFFNREGDFGRLSFQFRGFQLDEFARSGGGDFTDVVQSAGDINAGRPEWETQFTGIYRRGPLDVSLTWDFQDATQIFLSGSPVTIEQLPILEVEGSHLFSSTVAYDINDRVRAQFTVNNLTNVETFGAEGFFAAVDFASPVSNIGRSYTVTIRAKF